MNGKASGASVPPGAGGNGGEILTPDKLAALARLDRAMERRDKRGAYAAMAGAMKIMHMEGAPPVRLHLVKEATHAYALVLYGWDMREDAP